MSKSKLVNEMLSPWAYRLKRKLTAKQLARIKQSPPMVRKYIDKNGKKRVYRTELSKILQSSPRAAIIITTLPFESKYSGVEIPIS